MSDDLLTLAGRPVLLITDPVMDATDVIGRAMESGAEMVALHVPALPPDFLNLSSRVAGEMLQKLVNYRLRAAVVGDIEEAVAASNALRDFVRESNRGAWVWFVADLYELEARLA